jgi:hypothetical protein
MSPTTSFPGGLIDDKPLVDADPVPSPISGDTAARWPEHRVGQLAIPLRRILRSQSTKRSRDFPLVMDR